MIGLLAIFLRNYVIYVNLVFLYQKVLIKINKGSIIAQKLKLTPFWRDYKSKLFWFEIAELSNLAGIFNCDMHYMWNYILVSTKVPLEH